MDRQSLIAAARFLAMGQTAGKAVLGFLGRPRLWALPAFCTIGSIAATAFVFAAEVPTDEADMQKMIERAEARAAATSGSIEQWVQTLDHRGDAYADDAAHMADQNQKAVATGLGLMDDPALRAAGARMTAAPPTHGSLYVAISLSMPASTLQALAKDAQRAGAQLVIRGLTEGSFKTTMLKTRAVFDEHSDAGLAIDPNVFRAFHVDAVPAFIAAVAPVEPCRGLGCTPATPPHDKITGNISLAAALRELADSGDEAAPVAARALARLGS